jgi:putative addiction module component (TIGR02574 family)
MDLGTHPYETLEAEVLHLPREDRSKLASRLIESLDEDDDFELSAEWTEEIDRRMREVDEGVVQMISHEEVMQNVKARLAALKQASE